MPENPQNIDYRALMENALLQLESLQSKLDKLEQQKKEPIAIIGMGCRLPGGVDSPDAFWQLLENGIDGISAVPKDRWNIDQYYNSDPTNPGKISTRDGGFINQSVNSFDTDFFSISPREALSLDPQQRLLLEVSWEALENAHQVSQKLFNSLTGVFVGISSSDYSQRFIGTENIDAYFGTGNAFSAAVGRISYILGLTGPSLAVETACSSSLVAVHLAVASLRQRECNMALAGGVNLMLTPDVTITFSQAGMLAPDGRCKTFDASANGYVRGEGCGVIVLKRLSDAIADNDNILAVIRGSAVNQDGPSGGLTVPNGPSQEAVIRKALTNAGVKASQVNYIEAHGTGTSLGDPIEIGALGAVFTKNHTAEKPLFIGSAKTNIGHLEAAAGIAGLIKVILQLQHQKIAPHLHFTQPNPYINWQDLPVVIPTKATSWELTGKTRIAGVSSFGFSGTNSHVILESAPEQVKIKNVKNEDLTERPLHLLTLSAKTETALIELVKCYQKHLENNPDLSLADICYTANVGRSHFQHRLSCVASNKQELITQLSNIQDENTIRGFSRRVPKIAFLCTGQGSQYVGMGKELYETQPVFRKAIEECNQILKQYLEKSLIEILYTETDLINQTAYTQPALFAIEYALAQMWQSWGIKPDIVIGHSVGEYVAACLAGIFSLEDGLKLIAYRGQLMQQLPTGGEMVAVMATAAQIQPIIAPYKQQVSIAAYNTPNSIVISGAKAAIGKICSQLEQQNIKTKYLEVSHAFHSPLMSPMLAEFEKIAQQIIYNKPKIPLISNLTGQKADDSITTAKYWVNHISQPVRFAESITTLIELGYEVFLEIGPKPTLLGMGRQCLEDNIGIWLPSLRPGTGEWKQILQSLGQLYIQGAEIDWLGFDADYNRQKVQIPTYPFQRQRYWVETNTTNLVKKTNQQPLIGERLRLPFSSQIRFESQISINSPAHQEHHRIFGINIIAAASHIALTLLAVKQGFGTSTCTLEELFFQKAAVIPEDKNRTVQIVIEPENQNQRHFQIISLEPGKENQETDTAWVKHVSGLLRIEQEIEKTIISNKEIENIQKRCPQIVPGKQFYDELYTAGYTLGTAFQWIGKAWQGKGEALGQMELPEIPDTVNDYQLYPGLIDSCFQVLGMCQGLVDELDNIDKYNFIYIPFHIEKFQFFQKPKSSNLWCHARRITQNKEGSLIGDILIFDKQGEIIAKITNFEVRKASREVLRRSLQPNLSDWYYQVEWQRIGDREQVTGDSRKKEREKSLTLSPFSWLIFAPSNNVGAEINQKLEKQGYQSIVVYPGENYQKLNQNHYQISPTKPVDFEKLLQEISSTQKLDGVVHLWSLETTTESFTETQSLSCGSVLHLVQAMVANSETKLSQLCLVTQGVHQIDHDQEPIQVQQAPLWGLGKVIALEHPELNCRCLDLEIGIKSAEVAKIVFAEITAVDIENQIAYRQGVRQVMRLGAGKVTHQTHINIDSEASYLITGGLGALGLSVAQWLGSQGARHLVLMGRSEPSQNAQTKITELETLGIQVSVRLADISQAQDVEAIIEQIEASGKPLKGIIHGAGMLDDGMLRQITWERFSKVMQPKVEGAWYLHQFTKHLPLDFFVCFSSIASLFGSPGQGNYAAANAFMDALVYHRRALGLPGLSVNWGPWNEGGMAARLGDQYQQRLQAQGITSISPEIGFQALADLLATPSPQVGVFSINWSQWLVNQPQYQKLPFLAKYREINQATLAAQSEFLKELEAAIPSERRAMLESHVSRQVSEVLGLSKSRKIGLEEGFFDLGMDSLTSVDLRNRLQMSLGCSIPSTGAFDYPTIGDMVNYLIQDILEINFSEIEPENIQVAENINQELEDLSEDEIASLLAAELNGL